MIEASHHERASVADAELIVALQRHDGAAWAAFENRFRPTLEAYARKCGIPRWEWSACITELLADEALRLSDGCVEPPRRLDAYLVRAVRNKYLYLKRAAASRERHHVEASEPRAGEWIVPSTSSDDARRASAGPDGAIAETSPSLARFARDLTHGLTDEERALLAWVSEGVPRTTIAKWLGVGHEACAKRVWRLCRRLRRGAAARAASYGAGDRREVERFLRRAANPRAKG